jgi:hypothetical protein
MPTSGTSIFNLDLNNLIEEAFERCGSELRSGYDLRTARRTLNLLTIEWANRGINLWTIEQGTIPLVTGQAIYPVPSDTIQLLDTVIRQNPGTLNQSDINISNIAEPTYSSIPNKLAQGRPIQYWFNRQSGNENITTATLTANISALDTTISVSNAAVLASAGFIKIGNETISYPNVDITNNQLLELRSWSKLHDGCSSPQWSGINQSEPSVREHLADSKCAWRPIHFNLLENAPDAGCWKRHDGSRHPISIDPLHGLGHSVSFKHEATQRGHAAYCHAQSRL